MLLSVFEFRAGKPYICLSFNEPSPRKTIDLHGRRTDIECQRARGFCRCAHAKCERPACASGPDEPDEPEQPAEQAYVDEATSPCAEHAAGILPVFTTQYASIVPNASTKSAEDERRR